MHAVDDPVAERDQPTVFTRSPSQPPISPILRLYPALGHPAYRLLWFGNLPAMVAVMANQVAGPYTAFALSDSASVLGLVSVAQGLPMLLLGLVGGVAADRLPRKLVLICSQSTLGLAAAALAFFAVTGTLQVWHVVAASFMQGAAFAFNMPARQAYIAELVGRPLLASAVALNNAGQNFCRIFGPSLAGVLLAIPGVGIMATFTTIASMYVLALAALFRLPARNHPAGTTGKVSTGSAAQLTEGLRYVRSSPTIMALIGMNLVIVVFGMPYQTLMPVVAERVFDVGASGLGVLMAASGVGALVGAVAVAGLSRFRRPGALQLGLGVALGLALIAFALTRWFPLAVALLVIVGGLFSAFSALNNTLLMANAEPRLTGRVMSVYLLTWAAMPVGALPLAWLTDRAGAPVALGLAGGIIVIVVAGLALLHPPAHRIGWTPGDVRSTVDA